ncbi:MAG TPA: cytochrome c [Rhizomicrobium sp.]|jgi:mono/diheme cytochrome c family protein
MSFFRIVVAVLVVVIVAALGLFVWIISGPGPMDFAGGTRVALADYHGPDPTGVPASLAHADLVKRGEYLATVADCDICHTSKGGCQYAGGFAITIPFGTIYSSNITPDKDTGIGNYSDADFLNAVRRGIRRDGARLYPAMIYPTYSHMSDADALAIKAYLFSLAPVRATTRANTLVFPFNQRWALGLWSAFFNADTRFQPNTARSPAWNRGAYLSEALAHCGECHSPRTLAYSTDNRNKFAGAVAAGWKAYNITGDAGTGIGAWSDADLLAYLSQGHAMGHGTASGVMGEVVDVTFGHMAPEDIRAVMTYIRTVPAVTSTDLPATLAPPAPASPKQGVVANAFGKHIFEGACAACHGWTGQSPISAFATLTGARAVNDPSAINVAQIVITGTHRKTPAGVLSMPAFGTSFSDTDIAAVANYVTARFGAKGSELSVKDIADLRRQTEQP